MRLRQSGLAAGVRWDLSDLYAGPDDPRIEADLAQALGARAALRRATPRRRRAALRRARSRRAVDELEALGELAARPASYAQLLFAADTSAPRHGALLQRVQERGSEIRNELVFFELEWVALDDARRRALLADPALARAPAFSRRACAAIGRTCSPSPRRSCSRRRRTPGGAPSVALFDEMVAALRFSVTHAGETRELGEEEVLSLLYAPERELRREAARALTAGLRANARAARASSSTRSCRTRRSTIACAASPTRWLRATSPTRSTPRSVDALLAACSARYPLVARYYRLKARLLGLPQLEDFDRYAPIPEKGERAQLGRGARDRARPPTATSRRELAEVAERLLRAALDRRRAARRASAAAPSARRRCRACTRTCCSTTPATCAT